MRIIGGQLGGQRINPPKDLPVRPTTDRAKEALFNVLENSLTWNTLDCLDLFAGTGNISFELASRGSKSILAVDQSNRCVRFIRETAKTFGFQQLSVVSGDVLKFIERCEAEFDLIFADPPYDLAGLGRLPLDLFSRGLLRPNGLFVLEHAALIQLDSVPHYEYTRLYGSSAFSFFQN